MEEAGILFIVVDLLINDKINCSMQSSVWKLWLHLRRYRE